MKKELQIIAVGTIAIILMTFVLFPLTKISIASPDIEKRLEGAVMLYIGSPCAYLKNAEVQIDADNPEVMPIVRDQRTLVPARFIAESLGGTVTWDAPSSTVTITLSENTIKLLIGSNKMLVNGKEVELQVPAEAINNRTFVPLRALAEALGKQVFYDRGLIVISDTKSIFKPDTERLLVDKAISFVNKLPTVGSLEKLQQLLKDSETVGGYYRYREVTDEASVSFDMAKGMNIAPAQKSAAPAMNSQKADADTTSTDFSKTNVQVEGVDEADVVKTDGKYIYQVNNRRIIVAQAYPAQDMKILSTLDFTDERFSPREMYIDDKSLVVIGDDYSYIPMYKKGVERPDYIVPPHYSYNTAKIIIYDIADKTEIKKLREVEIEGYYVSSRKIGSALYFVANRNIYRYGPAGYAELDAPSYRDTAAKDEFVSIDYPDICYFPGCVYSNYMIVAGINLEKIDEEVKTSTFLGSGQNIYASNDNLYVAVTNHQVYRMTEAAPAVAPKMGMKIMPSIIRPYSYNYNTLVYKFSLKDGKATYLSKGEVPGTILNQFSMDEHQKHFRIATTVNGVWKDNGYTESTNNLYVLDEAMNIVGEIEDIAPGERIYSTRFMGDRGYMVTFRNVDPLFVMDLKDPKNPKILGALKIPGYSDYLHPYDENHIIGFGKDTVEVSSKTWDGKEAGTIALYQGLKMAIFDVSDVKNPVQKFTAMIGDRGTDSELLGNHKALLFSKEKNLIAFPVTLMEVKDKSPDPQTAAYQYGEFTFQGEFVYSIDLETGFSLKGRITHLTDEDYLKAGRHMYNNDRIVERGLYIGDVLYTLSKGIIKANKLSDLEEINELKIPQSGVR